MVEPTENANYDASNAAPTSLTAFRAAEKRYQLHLEQQLRRSHGRLRGGKLRARPTDLSDVIDVRRPPDGAPLKAWALATCGVEELPRTPCTPSGEAAAQQQQQQQRACCSCDCCGSGGSGSGGSSSVTALTFPAHGGLVVFPAALPPALQLQLFRDALEVWPEPPTRTNHAAAHGNLPTGLFAAAQAGLALAEARGPAAGSAGASQQPAEQQQQQQRAGQWSASGKGPKAAALLRKLRWASLGPPFNWTRRVYDHEAPHLPLPGALAAIARRFAALAGDVAAAGAGAGEAGAPSSGAAPGGSCGGGGGAPAASEAAGVCPRQQHRHHQRHGGRRPFAPDAAIANYYGAGDTLSGHRDDVEADLAQPIVTASLGAAAVFLVGGATRDEAPTALLLRSGDVAVLSGAARGCYHGVPRVLTEQPLPPELEAAAAAAGPGFAPHLEHMRRCRVNVSVRSVA